MQVPDPPIESMPAGPPPGSPPAPGIPQQSADDSIHAAALSELQRLRSAFAEASSYGAGTNAQGKAARKRAGSNRPSHILPEAWANMGDAQKIKAEHDIEAKRKVIKAEIDALLEKFPS